MPTRPTLLPAAYSYAVKINGVDLHDYGALTYRMPSLSMAPAEIAYQTFYERHDARAFSGAFRPRVFTITGTLVSDASAANLRTNLDLLRQDIASFRGNRFEIPTPIRVEINNFTDRYYPCLYTGEFNVQGISGRDVSDAYARFTLTLTQLTPFAIANDITTAAPSGTGPSFTVLDCGSAPCPWLVEFEGAANALDFCLSDMNFYADFDWDAIATIIDGTSVTGTVGAGTKSDQFEPGDYGGRYIQEATFNTTWAGVVQNITEGTYILSVRPQFASTVATNMWLFEHYIDASNGTRLVYESTADKWYFEKEIGGAGVICGSGASAQSFSSDDRMVLAFSYGSAGMKVYRDGVLLDTVAGTTTGVTGASGTLYLGDQAETYRPPCKYDYVHGFPFQLSDTDVKRYSLNPEMIRPYNVKKSKSDNLAADARCIVDFEKETFTLVSTALVQTSDASKWDTSEMPWLRPSQVCFYVPTGESIQGIKVRYRKRWF